MNMSVARHHTDWLSLIEVSGPFLTLPVLKRALPQGLEPVDRELVDELRRAHQEWQDDRGLHGEWVRWVLASLLGFDEETLKDGPTVPPTLEHGVSEHGETLRPDLVVLDPSQNGKVVPRLLVTVWPTDTDLDAKIADRRWAATPLGRMAELLRAKRARLGLVTNGERWTLVHAAVGGPATYATWDAGIWLEDRPTLDAFVTLLSARRFFAVAESDTLTSLFEESANAEQEVTDQLGRQVRQAVELVVDAFGRADREHKGKLLEGISEGQIYSAAVTVMMRLVFLLCAEERGLFLLGDPLYDNTYAVSTLRAQLQEEADRHGEEPLERRSSAWHRLLATFRMVHAGVEHENLRLPAYGGTLFDADRFPFLEGRNEGELWQEHPGRPLPLDDRTVLHILDALQVLRFHERGGVTEARRLSFRALDVEQIGHVYEGLLDHTVVEATDPAVGLEGKLEPEIPLAELEEKAEGEREELVEWLAGQTGRSKKAIEKALDAPFEPHERALLRAACDMDAELADRVAPFHALLRHDLRGLPQVYLSGGVYVTKTLERRSSGTYYTPRSLAEEMVRYALEPLVYKPGPAEGADANEWKLRSPAELLELKVCDMAMGSGAFLVASCRYLADRLIEAWEEAGDGPITVEGEPAAGKPDELLVPDDPDDRAVLARRLIADRCLYGVDKNPMAVEMAKLSIWLVTLAKDRPFSFVDHALRSGDSLLGVTGFAQIENLHIDPTRGRELFHAQLFDYQSIFAPAVERAVERRRALEAFPVITLRDAQEKETLFREAEQELEALKVVGDVIIGAAISTALQGEEALERRLLSAADDVAAALDPERKESDRKVRLRSLYWDAVEWLNTGRPIMQEDRRTFHWPLEFPEVFVRGGFDAIVGNPPFLGGTRISGPLGDDYRQFLARHIAKMPTGRADLASFFFLRAASLVRQPSCIGLLATNTISQGDTREAGLDRMCADGWSVHRAWKSRPWPGEASLEVAQVWLYSPTWASAAVLNGEVVEGITSTLDRRSRITGTPYRLAANRERSFIGSYVYGEGFLLQPEEAKAVLSQDSRNEDVVLPYLTGEDLNTSPTQSPSRWVIYFDDLSEDEASQYTDCWRIVFDRVRPERLKQDAEKYPTMVSEWWKFWRTRGDLYAAIDGLHRVIAVPRVTKHVAVALVPTGLVFSDRVVVIAWDDYSHLGLFSSQLHVWWVLTRSATFETRPTYNPTDCFETFPQPDLTDRVGGSGEALDKYRRPLMLERDEGLTKTYNRLHNPEENATDIAELRRLHVELDHAVAAAYGWGDVDLDHGFHETPQGVRYTIGPVARVEVLDRLLELNHERYVAEVAAGLHDKKKAAKPKRNRVALADQTTLEGMS
jgi:methylase of polypeptide subunit release factors